MNAVKLICKIIDERHLKQASIAVAAGYTTRAFNDLLKGRKKFTAEDVVPICKVLEITPNELFGYTSSQSETPPGHDGNPAA